MPGIGQSGGSPVPHADSLGVIISLPPALAEQLSERRGEYGGPAAGVVPPHITLVRCGGAVCDFTAGDRHI